MQTRELLREKAVRQMPQPLHAVNRLGVPHPALSFTRAQDHGPRSAARDH